MTKLNVAVRRRDTQTMIDEDICWVQVYRAGETPDDPETSLAFTARVQPAGSRGMGADRAPSGMPGEHSIGRFSHVLLMPYDAPVLRTGDQVETRSQLDPGVIKKFRCVYCTQYSYKVEATLDELA